jgi:thymidylate kinase
MMDWILALETGQFALPRPDLSIYLDTPWDLAKRADPPKGAAQLYRPRLRRV